MSKHDRDLLLAKCEVAERMSSGPNGKRITPALARAANRKYRTDRNAVIARALRDGLCTLQRGCLRLTDAGRALLDPDVLA